MARPASPFRRYIQVENFPRNAYTTAANSDRFVPSVEAGHFKKKAAYTSLMNTVYGAAAPTAFAGFSVEAEDYLRARIGISSGHEVVVLDNLENRHAGEPGYRKMKDLVSHALTRVGVRGSDVNLIVIPNIDNAVTRTAIRTLQRDEGWETGTWIATNRTHSATILATDLGRTAKSVAAKLGKNISAIYVGEITSQPTLAFALAAPGAAPAAAPATYPPSRPGTPQAARPAVPRAPTPVRRNRSGCSCIIC